jgi:hypothetical protein
MYLKRLIWVISLTFLFMAFTTSPGECAAKAPELKFDHNHTFAEVVSYLNGVVKAYPDIAKLHKIGKSYLGKDLLVLEITNMATGKGLEKPGYWIDGNLHASEVMGAEVCLKTIDTLVTQYGKDSSITDLVDTRAIYIMPKLNPDGSDHYLTKPDGMRSSVRPHDSDRDGLLDEDPSEDLNGDGNLTMMRIKDELGPMKTSSEDPRLMVRRKDEEKGEWRIYSGGWSWRIGYKPQLAFALAAGMDPERIRTIPLVRAGNPGCRGVSFFSPQYHRRRQSSHVWKFSLPAAHKPQLQSHHRHRRGNECPG